MYTFLTQFKSFLKNKSGATTIEYGLGFALLVGGTAASMQTMNESIEQSFFCNAPDQRNMHKDECDAYRSKYQQDRYNTQNAAKSDITHNAQFKKPTNHSTNAKGKDFDTGLSVRAGESFIIKPANPNAQVSFSGRSKFNDPFNTLNGALNENGVPQYANIGLPKSTDGHVRPAAFATITPSSLDGNTVTYNNFPHLSYSFAENGQIQITAQQDGKLQVGIMDIDYGDNRVSNSVDGDYGYVIERVL